MQFPRVLVMGATGRIGTILRRTWAPGRALWQMRTESAAESTAESTTGLAGDAADLAVLDPLGDPAALARAAQGCGAVLCLAGVTPTAAALGRDMADNAALALAAVRAAAGAGVPVLLASSAAVYGDSAEDLTEASPRRPLSDYGRAKAGMEEQAADLGARLGVPVTALRIGNVAGSDAILGGWRPGFRLDRFADGHTPRRSYIGPLTLARVLGDLVQAGGLPRVLNLAAPGTVEMGALLDAAGLDWTARPAPPGTIAEVRLDVSALLGFTALTPKDSLPEILVAEWRQLEPVLTP